MTKCTLCMTEVDPAAVVCRGCGATKMLVRERMGYIKGAAMLGVLMLGILIMLAGRLLAGAICLGIGVLIARSQPQRLMWVRTTLQP